jgi:phosphoserine phosphatase RsbU/P
VESERLIANPLTRLCIGHMSPPEQEALENDLELAAQIQNGLLPQPAMKIDGWEIAFHYEPASLVSGDYCDVITSNDESFHFMVGDVSGKGVAASMLMAHLQAMFRTLISIKLPLTQILERASSVFCESTLPSHYATLVCGNVRPDGLVQISNAGHLPPLVVRNGNVRSIDATGLPIGMFSAEKFSVTEFQMERGDVLLLYTDGLSEALDGDGSEFGEQRISKLLELNHSLTPRQLIGTLVTAVQSFRNGGKVTDDLTLMAIKRVS